MQSKTGIRGYLRFNLHEILIRKKPALKKIQFLIHFLDNSLNLVNDLRIAYLKKTIKQTSLKYEFVNSFDAELSEFIENSNKEQLTHRISDDLQWILRFPWIINTPFNDDYNSRYYFSALSSRFANYCIKMYDKDEKIKGFLLMTLNDNKLTIPYCYFNQEDTQQIVQLVHKILVHLKPDYFTIYHPVLVSYMQKNKSPFVFKKKIERNYIATNELVNLIENKNEIVFQDGDGDPVFTG